jgi:hypothetical protein
MTTTQYRTATRVAKMSLYQMLDCPTHGSGQHRYFALYAITALAKMDPPQVLSYLEGVVEVSNEKMNIQWI